MQGLQLSCS